MEIKSLYTVFDFPFIKEERELIVCKDPRESFSMSKDILNKHYQPFQYHETNLEITRVNSSNLKIITRFVGENNPESLRGMSLDRVYLEDTIKNDYLTDSILKPMLFHKNGKLIKIS